MSLNDNYAVDWRWTIVKLNKRNFSPPKKRVNKAAINSDFLNNSEAFGYFIELLIKKTNVKKFINFF